MVEYKEFILGALLHDIGKAIISEKGEKSPNLHVYYPEKDKIKKEELEEKLEIEQLGISQNDFIWHAIVYHHAPNESRYKDLLKIIQKADNEASELRLKEEEKEQIWKVKIIYPWSILTEEEKYTNIYSLKDLSLRDLEDLEKIFTDVIDLEDYRNIWKKFYQKKFLSELRKALRFKDVDTVLAILYKWLYFYPEAAGYSDTNLFSLAFHLKTTAMLADLYYKRDIKGKKVFVITIDLVGTHRTIVSFLRRKKEFWEEGKYLKKVNYLSRYIDALVAYVARKILEIARSYTTNILFISGSLAKLVVALDSEQRTQIEKFVEDINKRVFRLTLGNSFILLDFEKIDCEQLLEGIVKAAFGKDKSLEIENKKLRENLYLSTYFYDINTKEIYDEISQFMKTLKDKLYDPKIIKPKDIGFDGNEPLVVTYECLLNNEIEEFEDSKNEEFFNKTKIFIYLKSGRLNVSIDDIEDVSQKTKRIAFLKIDGDMVGNLFSKLLSEYIRRKIGAKYGFQNSNIFVLLILRLSELLSFMFKYEILEIAEKLNREHIIDETRYKKAISIVYNSGDELLAIGDVELILEFYYRFLMVKEKLLCNVLKTSTVYEYIHYRHPFNFIYEEIRDLPKVIKVSKKYYDKVKELIKLGKYISAFEKYKEMKDGILFLKGKIFHRNSGDVSLKKMREIISNLIELTELSRTKITNIKIIFARILEELNNNMASSVINLIYYTSKDDKIREYFIELLKDIKNNFSLENKEKTKEILNYWLSILDYVKTVTRS